MEFTKKGCKWNWRFREAWLGKIFWQLDILWELSSNLYWSPSLLRQKYDYNVTWSRISLTRARPTRCRGRWLSSLSGCPCSSGPATWCSETASLQTLLYYYIIILCRQTIRGEEKTSCIRWDSDNLFKIPGPTLGEKLGYFQDIYSLTHTRLCHCLIKQDKTHFVTGVTHSDSPPFVSFHTIPSRLMLVPGSQGPRDSGSVRVPASAVLEAICNTRLLGCFIWIVICLIETLCVWFFEWFYESLFRLIFNC